MKFIKLKKHIYSLEMITSICHDEYMIHLCIKKDSNTPEEDTGLLGCDWYEEFENDFIELINFDGDMLLNLDKQFDEEDE